MKKYQRILTSIYKADNQDQGYEKLIEFEEKWGKKSAFYESVDG